MVPCLVNLQYHVKTGDLGLFGCHRQVYYICDIHVINVHFLNVVHMFVCNCLFAQIRYIYTYFSACLQLIATRAHLIYGGMYSNTMCDASYPCLGSQGQLARLWRGWHFQSTIQQMHICQDQPEALNQALNTISGPLFSNKHILRVNNIFPKAYPRW